MATVSRLVLAHPALGTTGGVALHTSIEALYQKIGDAIASRWFQLADFDQTETVDLQHDFDTDITNLRYDIYVFTGGQWVLLTDQSTPLRSDFTVIEKVGFEDITLQITNNTGGNDLLAAVVITNDPLHIKNGDIADIDVATVAPVDGATPTYDATTLKFITGFSGFQQIVGTGFHATLTAAVAAASAGESILVINNTTEPAGDLTIGVADLRIVCKPGVTVGMNGAMTNGMRLTAARINLDLLRLTLAPSGAQARGLSVEAADCIVDAARIETTTAQTFTDLVHITSGGVRAYVRAGVLRTLGTITNLLTNNDGAGDASVYGG